MHDELGDALGRSHDTRGTNRLVSADEHEMFGLTHCGRRHDVTSAEDIVEDRLADVGFHQRYVLMCRRVKHGKRPVGRENSFDTLAVAHIANDWIDAQSREVSAKLLKQFE